MERGQAQITPPVTRALGTFTDSHREREGERERGREGGRERQRKKEKQDSYALSPTV